jgi:hypothetical protein
MADPDLTMPQRQTYPAIRGRVEDQVGALPLADADSIDLLTEPIAGGTLIELPVTVLDPEDPDSIFTDVNGSEIAANWEAPIAVGFSDDLGQQRGKLKITWDSASTPPRIQYAPKVGFIIFEITENVDETP